MVRPGWSYLLNADFEDHAEQEYMTFVDDHPDWEHSSFESEISPDYGTVTSSADLFCQIGHDERVHKQESLELSRRPCFR